MNLVQESTMYVSTYIHVSPFSSSNPKTLPYFNSSTLQSHSPTKDKKATSYQPSHHDQPLTVERDQPIAKKEVHPEKQTVEKEHYHSQAITRDQPLASNIDQTDGDVAKEEEHRLESKGKHEHHTKERQQSSRRCAESYERKESTERHRRMSGHSSRKRQELGT